MEKILKLSPNYGWKHYFYGSSQNTLDKLVKNLLESYPGLQVVGTYSPPFRSMTKEEDETIVQDINACSPNFLWVGLGAPKQEKWMAAHQERVKGLMVGVGAAFDYYAGNLKRSPKWMQNNNLEWLYRLAQEPKRLWKRYFITNSKFIWNAVIRRK